MHGPPRPSLRIGSAYPATSSLARLGSISEGAVKVTKGLLPKLAYILTGMRAAKLLRRFVKQIAPLWRGIAPCFGLDLRTSSL